METVMAYYFITNQEFSTSKITGSEVVTLTLVDIDTREEYRCYVDSSMENFTQWADVLLNPQKGFVLTGLKRKRNHGRYNHEILNADSDFVIAYEDASLENFHRKLKMSWAKEDFLRTPFGRLFE